MCRSRRFRLSNTLWGANAQRKGNYSPRVQTRAAAPGALQTAPASSYSRNLATTVLITDPLFWRAHAPRVLVIAPSPSPTLKFHISVVRVEAFEAGRNFVVATLRAPETANRTD